MFKVRTTGTHLRQTRRVHTRLAASASAIALVLLLTGNVSGRHLALDSGRTPLVTPKQSRPVVGVQLRSKLATHAGRNVLEHG